MNHKDLRTKAGAVAIVSLFLLTSWAGCASLFDLSLDLDATHSQYAFTIKYDSNGAVSGSVSDTVAVDTGDEYEAEVSSGSVYTAPKGKYFFSWNTKADGSGNTYTEGQIVSYGPETSETDIEGGVLKLYAIFVVQYHTFGPNNRLSWAWDDGALIIIGDATIPDYDNDANQAPWRQDSSIRDYITSISLSQGISGIGSYNFYDLDHITAVTVPSGVRTIGDFAFFECDNMTHIMVAESNIYYRSVDGALLGYNRDQSGNRVYHTDDVTGMSDYLYTLIYVPQKNHLYQDVCNFIIPGNVTGIENYAFYNCTGFSAVKVTEYVSSIGSHAFHGCSGLKYISLPPSVTDIGDAAFYGCENIVIVQMGDFTTDTKMSLGSNIFQGCTKITAFILNGTLEGTIDATKFGLGDTASWYKWDYNTINTEATYDTISEMVEAQNPSGAVSPSSSWSRGHLYARDSNLGIFGAHIDHVIESRYSEDYKTYSAGPIAVQQSLMPTSGIDQLLRLDFITYSSGIANYELESETIGRDTVDYPSTDLAFQSYVIADKGHQYFICVDDVVFIFRSGHNSTIVGSSFSDYYMSQTHISDRFAPEHVIYQEGITTIGVGTLRLQRNLSTIDFPTTIINLGGGDRITGPNIYAFDIDAQASNQYVGKMMNGDGAEGFCTGVIIKNFTISPFNSTLAEIDGVLTNFSKDRLYCYPGGRADSYVIPNGIKYVGQAFRASSVISVLFNEDVTSTGAYLVANAPNVEYIMVPEYMLFLSRNSGWFRETGADALLWDAQRGDPAEVPHQHSFWQDNSALFYVKYPLDMKTNAMSSYSEPWSNNQDDSQIYISGYPHSGAVDGPKVRLQGETVYYRQYYLEGEEGTQRFAVVQDLDNYSIYLMRTTDKITGDVNEDEFILIIIPNNRGTGDPDLSLCNSYIAPYKTKIQHIVMTSGVKEIPSSLFNDMTSLKTVVIPYGTTTISPGAFSGDSSLNNIYIPSTVINISKTAFSGCTSLKNLIVSSKNVYYSSSSDSFDSIPVIYKANWTSESTTDDDDAPFDLRTIPNNTVWNIDPTASHQYRVFSHGTWQGHNDNHSAEVVGTNQNNWYRWVASDNIYKVVPRYFANTPFEDAQEGDLAYQDSENKFYKYTGGKWIEYTPNTVSGRGFMVHRGYDQTNLYILDGLCVTKVNTIYITTVCSPVDFNNSYTFVYGSYRYSCPDCSIWICPEGYTGEYVAPEYAVFKGAHIPIKSVTESAFRSTSLTAISLSESIVSIEDAADSEHGAFSGSSSLIDFTSFIRDVGDYAFSDSKALRNVTFKSPVMSIGVEAFVCKEGGQPVMSSLSSISFSGSGSIGMDDSFYNMDVKYWYLNGLDMVSPSQFINGNTYFITGLEFKQVESYDIWWAVDGSSLILWSKLGSPMPNFGTGENQPPWASYGDTISNIRIQGTITTIGDHAFEGFSNIAGVDLIPVATYIGDYAFSGCTSLEDFSLCDSLNRIGAHAFDGCSTVTQIILPDSIRDFTEPGLGDYSFYDCTSLTRVVLGCQNLTIGAYAFELSTGSSVLEKVVFRASSTTLSGNAGVQNVFARTSWYKDADVTLSDITDLMTGLVVSGPVVWSKDQQDAGGDIDTNISWLYSNNTLTISVKTSGQSALIQEFGIGLAPWYIFRNEITALSFVDSESDISVIGDAAFYGLSNLSSISLPSGVTGIGRNAFSACSSLSQLVVTDLDYVTYIGQGAFVGCAEEFRLQDSSESLQWNDHSYTPVVTSQVASNSVLNDISPKLILMRDITYTSGTASDIPALSFTTTSPNNPNGRIVIDTNGHSIKGLGHAIYVAHGLDLILEGTGSLKVEGDDTGTAVDDWKYVKTADKIIYVEDNVQAHRKMVLSSFLSNPGVGEGRFIGWSANQILVTDLCPDCLPLSILEDRGSYYGLTIGNTDFGTANGLYLFAVRENVGYQATYTS